MATAVSLSVLAALTVANPSPSLPSGGAPAARVAFSATAPLSRLAAAARVSDVIPPALEDVTQCMLNAAKATSGVISAERAVSVRDGETDIHVRYEYRMEHGRNVREDYVGQLVSLRNALNRASTAKWPLVEFWTIHPGAGPVCDPVARSGPYHCEHNPGAGIFETVTTAWRQTCGVEIEVLTV